MLGSFQEPARLLVAFPVEIMQQVGSRAFGQLPRQFIEPGEQRQQVRFRVRRRHRFHRAVELDQRLQNVALGFGHASTYRWAARWEMKASSRANFPSRYDAARKRTSPVTN